VPTEEEEEEEEEEEFFVPIITIMITVLLRSANIPSFVQSQLILFPEI
jgi:hypothetical protein